MTIQELIDKLQALPESSKSSEVLFEPPAYLKLTMSKYIQLNTINKSKLVFYLNLSKGG